MPARKCITPNGAQKWDDDLDYNYYCQRALAGHGSELVNLLAQANPVTDPTLNARRYGELVEQFESMYSIREVTMSLEVK